MPVTATQTPHVPSVRLLTVAQFRAARPEIGQRTIYEWMHAGRLKTVRVGRRFLIPSTELDDLIERETR